MKRSYWYAYENNLVVVHQGNEELAQKMRTYILNPKGSDVVPPEYLTQLRKEMKQARREEEEAQAQAEKEAKEKARAEKAARAQAESTPPAEEAEKKDEKDT